MFLFDQFQRQSVTRVISSLFLMICCLLGATTGKAATDVSLDLKVLVISSGSADEDIGLDLIDGLLDQMGVPYEVLDSSRENLTAQRLSTQQRGHYNGIIITNTDLFVMGGASGFTLAEWQILHAYERDFSVREAVLSGFPVTNPALDLDYGMINAGSGIDFSANWLSPAGGTEYFEYVNTNRSLDFQGYSVFAQPRADGTGPMVQPLLVDRADVNRTLISLLTYPDGREVLLSTITNAWYFVHSNMLAYEFINFATKGLFIGARQVHLSAHLDDIFLPNALWNTATNTTDQALTYRLSPADITNIIGAGNRFRNRYPTANQVNIDLAFNGFGVQFTRQNQGLSSSPLPLVDTIQKSQKPKSNRDSLTAMLAQFIVPQGIAMAPSSATLDLWVAQVANGNQDKKKKNKKADDDKKDKKKKDKKDDDDKKKKEKRSKKQSNKSDRIIQAKVCRVTQAWYQQASGSNKKSRKKIISTIVNKKKYDQTSCIAFDIAGQPNVAVDISPILQSWFQGAANHGLIVISSGKRQVLFGTKSRKMKARRPQLSMMLNVPTGTDALTTSIVQNKDKFRFLSHTFTHRALNASAGIGYPESVFEITENRKIWDTLGLPARAMNDPVLITGAHSGIKEDNATADPSDDIPFPEGVNKALMRAAQDLGVRFLASDASQVNEALEQRVPGFDVILLPRWPSNVYFNTTTDNELTDEYNYIFYERHINAGQDPCMIPGAICLPRNFQEIMKAEAVIALRHMLSYRMWPHFFHQTNMRNYDGQGSTLIYDWLQAVLNEYQKYVTLPIKNLAYFDIAKDTEDRLLFDEASIKGVWNVTQNTITLSADRPVAQVFVTGLSGGELYGGQRLKKVDLTSQPQQITVDRALFQ